MSAAPVLGPIGELSEHAQRYAAAGLEVFPVNPTDKTPLTSQYQATTDTATVERWWADRIDALIGHRLPTHQVILDIDPRHGGDKTWKMLKEMFAIPDTRAHRSGRGDEGGHSWWLRPSENLTITKLDAWAREHGVGEAVENSDRWTSGIDLLHRTHRYTILPPSPHPVTGKPYTWIDGRGLEAAPQPLPSGLAELITRDPAPPPKPPRDRDPESIADWYTEHTNWTDLLGRHGWTLIAGDGNSDGSRWRHPTATNAFSATITHGCLFVYSPNTPFDPTAPGEAHGYTPFRAAAILDHQGDLTTAARAARITKDGDPAEHDRAVDQYVKELEEAAEADPDVKVEPLHGVSFVDWPQFWAREHVGEDWLIDPILPRSRQVALWAAHKTGKSLLTLEVAAALATGSPCLRSTHSVEPVNVIYADMEMTEDDLHERLEALGYGPDDDLSRLHYALLPSLPPLDSAEGGQRLTALAKHYNATAVVLDTMSRVTAGDENDADTYRAFYRHTGLHLKAAGVSVLRLDHGGKDSAKGQRGSSGKGDDVDVIWELKAAQTGLELRRTASRISWVPERVRLQRLEDPLRHQVAEGDLWATGTKSTATYLDELDVDLDASQRVAGRALRDAGLTARNEAVRDALKWRREQAASSDWVTGETTPDPLFKP